MNQYWFTFWDMTSFPLHWVMLMTTVILPNASLQLYLFSSVVIKTKILKTKDDQLKQVQCWLTTVRQRHNKNGGLQFKITTCNKKHKPEIKPEYLREFGWKRHAHRVGTTITQAKSRAEKIGTNRNKRKTNMNQKMAVDWVCVWCRRVQNAVKIKRAQELQKWNIHGRGCDGSHYNEKQNTKQQKLQITKKCCIDKLIWKLESYEWFGFCIQ